MVQKINGNESAEAANPILPPVPFLDGKKIRAWYNPTALAFLGDSIWEVFTFLTYIQVASAPCLQRCHSCDASLPNVLTCRQRPYCVTCQMVAIKETC